MANGTSDGTLIAEAVALQGLRQGFLPTPVLDIFYMDVRVKTDPGSFCMQNAHSPIELWPFSHVIVIINCLAP